jgi:hypothetical protein
MNQFEYIDNMQKSGFTIMETIKAVMREYNLSLGQAKTVVSSHPSWSLVVKATQYLYDDLDGDK